MKEKKEFVRNVRDLQVYQLAFNCAMEIFQITKNFPREEKYSMTDQIRRASRSVCSNLAEGWYKRKYRAVFVNKLTDSAEEASETITWLEFSLACEYIDKSLFEDLTLRYEKIIGQLITMEVKSESFCKIP